ncbi:MAG: vWA domain-containing protein [Blastocatellia bacterium]
MANKQLFQTTPGALAPQADARNNHGARAYAFTAKHELAQYAATGCLNATFYAGAEEQLARVLELCADPRVTPEFIARTAVYSRTRGYMKDMPALMTAILSVRDIDLFKMVFPRVIDNGRMLRNFVQVMRSGVTGRKSMGTLPRRMIREWFDTRTDEAVFQASVGNDPSFADIVRMVHPAPGTASREALFGWMLGRDHDADALPGVVRQFEQYKTGAIGELPQVPFQMLTALNLGTPEWTAIARNASWQTTRMNLNTFARHGVFAEPGMARLIAARLRDAGEVRGARAFPYQLLSAYNNVDEKVPAIVREALQDAMEIAIDNVPAFAGTVFVCPDVSGSMQSPVTGQRRGAASKVRCIDVAALVAAAVLRNNRAAEVIPFEHDVVKLSLNPRDSVMTNARKLASIGGGGTNCSAPLRMLNERRAKGDLVIFVSDNESWVDAGRGRGTATMHEWMQFRRRNPEARLVCIDIQPYGTTQAKERPEILNVGGFSDQVFDVIAEFAAGRMGADHWVSVIENVSL